VAIAASEDESLIGSGYLLRFGGSIAAARFLSACELKWRRIAAGGIAMKFAICVFAVLWFLCGVAGAWMLDDLNADHWKMIAKGPITLVRAANDTTISWPWD